MSSDDESPTEADPGVARRRATERASRTRYQLGEPIGHGGMGEVINARDLQIGRDVAIKRMLTKEPSERGLERFLREARIQGRLDHPAIVPVHELGHDLDGNPFFVMKKLSGTTLAKILGTPDAMTREKLLRAFADVCLAVAFAHTHGVIHRDLKPANIVLGDFGEVYVLDWGVAKLVGDVDDSIDPTASGDSGTGAGQSIGTPGYMAPEQVANASDVDERADVYALGCMLFEILTGAPLHPRGKRGLTSAVTGIDARASVRAPDRAIPPELDDLCVHATAPRDARLASARELADAVLRYLDGDRDLARRRELASTHLAAARAAFAAGDDEHHRRTAIREAGRALALDPTLAGAAELVGRLMLEPPRSLPHDVERDLAVDLVETNRRQARTSIWISAFYAGFVPFVFVAGSWLYAGVFTAYLAFNTFVLRYRARRGSANHPYWNALRNVMLVALAAHAYSPFLVGPGLAAATAAALLLTAMYTDGRRFVVMIGMMSLAVFVPWAIEAVGLVAPTMTKPTGGVTFDSPAIEAMGHPLTEVGLVVYTIGLIAAIAAMGHAMIRRDRDSRRHLYLQAWQLRQLVS